MQIRLRNAILRSSALATLMLLVSCGGSSTPVPQLPNLPFPRQRCCAASTASLRYRSRNHFRSEPEGLQPAGGPGVLLSRATGQQRPHP